MHKKYSSFFIVFGLLVITILSISSVSAAASAPTDLSIDYGLLFALGYDEGNFAVNWNAGAGGDPVVNYGVFVSAWDPFNDLTDTTDNSTTSYSLTNLDEDNYTIILSAVNATGFVTNSSTSDYIYVDKTPPAITLSGYTNATFKKNSDTLTLNILVNDDKSGELGSVCLIDVNGANQSIPVSAKWCNGTVDLTGLSDGNQIITIYANDTLNNLAVNADYVVSIDSTDPVPTASCIPSSAASGVIVMCTCSGDDGSGSGIDSSLTEASLNITTSSAGTFFYTCSVTDDLGNSGNTTTSYTVTDSSSSSSSGGGGGGGGGSTTTTTTTSETTVAIAERDSENDSIIVEFDEEVGVKEIQIRVNNDAQGVKIIVSKYEEKPEEVTVEKLGEVYQYMQIETENLEDNLESAVVTIRVEKSWVAENNLSKDDLALFKFNEETNEWNELVTIYKEEDETYYYFDAALTSLSFFAISVSERIKLTEIIKENLVLIGVIALVVVLIILGVYLIKRRGGN